MAYLEIFRYHKSFTLSLRFTIVSLNINFISRICNTNLSTKYLFIFSIFEVNRFTNYANSRFV